MEEETLLQQIRDLVVKDSIYQVRVESVYPREKDGGAFVKFSYSLPKVPYAEELATEEAEANDKKQEAEVLKILEKQAVGRRRLATRTMRSCSLDVLQVHSIKAAGWKPMILRLTEMSAVMGKLRTAPAFLVKVCPNVVRNGSRR